MASGKITSKEKEAEVLRLNGQGLIHTVIARRLGLDRHTVRRIIKLGNYPLIYSKE